MAKAKAKKAAGPVQLTEEQSNWFERYVRKAKQASAGRRADDEARHLRDQLLTLMGKSRTALLADGREIERVKHEADYRALPPRKVTWESLSEVTGE